MQRSTSSSPRSTASGSGGFTIVELLVAVGILALTTGLVGSGIFQSFAVQRSWSDDMRATRDLRHTGSWFATDSLNAQTTDLADGAPPSGEVTLTWSDAESASHTARYRVTGDSLIRTYDGTDTVVARRVTSATFSLVAGLLILDIAVEAAGGTESMSHRNYLRMLGP